MLIKDDLPREKWRIWKINKLIVSRDGEARSANVHLPSQKLIGRPLNQQFPLECPAEDNQSVNKDTGNGNTTDKGQDELKVMTRPRVKNSQ